MKRSVVGQLKEVICFDQLGKELVKGGMNMLRARYMGDNQALLTPKEGVDMEALILHNKDWFDSVFCQRSTMDGNHYSGSQSFLDQVLWLTYLLVEQGLLR